MTVQLYMDMPKGFFPQEDTGLLRGATEGPPDTSFAAMAQRQQAMNEIVRQGSGRRLRHRRASARAA